MQHKYVGDIGDYSKFVLIKHLFNRRCALLWYLYPNENNNDGVHINYEKYNLKDEEVVELMKEASKNRNIGYLEKLLKDFKINFFSECIEEGSCKFFKDYKKRIIHRREWFCRGVNCIKTNSVVFVDPDNGIEVKSCPTKGRKKSGKYIFFDEIDFLFKEVKTLVIYQHFIRKKTDEFIDELEKKLRKKVGKSFNFYAIKFKRVSPRAYLILSKENLEEKIKNFCNKFSNEFELLKVSYGKTNN